MKAGEMLFCCTASVIGEFGQDADWDHWGKMPTKDDMVRIINDLVAHEKLHGAKLILATTVRGKSPGRGIHHLEGDDIQGVAEEALTEAGFKHIFTGTPDADPSLDDDESAPVHLWALSCGG